MPLARRLLIHGRRDYREAVLDLGPVGYWRLGEAAGAFARDECGRNHGTYVNSPTLGAAGLLAGDPDTAMRISVAGQSYMTVPSAPALKPTSAISFGGLISASDGSTVHYVARSSGGAYLLMLRTEVTTGVARLYASTSAGVGDISGAVSLLDGAPHRLFGTFDGLTLRLYVDGVLVNSVAKAGTLVLDTAAWNFGAYGTEWNACTVDEVSIWDRALNAAEVAYLDRVARGY